MKTISLEISFGSETTSSNDTSCRWREKMITMNFTTVNFARGSILFENDDLFMFIV